MFKIFVTLALVSAALSQSIDKTFCDIDTFVEAPDADKNPLPSIPLTLSYECDIEQNSEGATVEIKEWYVGLANEARSRTIGAGLTLNQYVYPNDMELLETINNKCKRFDLNDPQQAVNIESTPFLTVQTVKGLRVVGGTFGILDATRQYVDQSLRVKYLGNLENIRGIPTRKWVGCLFDKNKVKTTKVFLWYSDNINWTPAHTVANKTVPIQVEISSKTGNTITTEVNSILRYREKTVKQENIYTEPGIYCEGRKSDFEMPKFPKSFRTTIQMSHPNINSFGMSGNVTDLKVDYDLDKNYMSIERFEKDQLVRELHDWNTGLLYKSNKDTDICQVSKLSDGEATELKDIFHVDGQPPYQWTGQRRVRGINCDVFIAPRVYNGKNVTFEYHFATALWQEQGGRNMTQFNPILLTVTPTDVPYGQEPDSSYFHYMDWDTTVADLFRFDVSNCQKNIPNKHIRFEIKPSVANYEVMKTNQFDVKTTLTQALLDLTGVRLTRFGGIETIYHNKTIFVTFTLFDKPAFYGKNDPEKEPTLTDAETKLSTSIANEAFSFNYMSITARPEKNSYIILEKRDGRFVYEISETGETINYSGGSVVAFLIVFVLFGMVIGFVTGYFLIIKRTKPLPALPGPLGFLNPLASGSNA